MHPALAKTVADDRIIELRREAHRASMARDANERERAPKLPAARRGGVVWLRRIATAFGAFVALGLLAPAALAMPVEPDRGGDGKVGSNPATCVVKVAPVARLCQQAGTGQIGEVDDPASIASGGGTLAQLGSSANIASGASQGYISSMVEQPRVEPVAPVESSSLKLWVAGALAVLATGAAAIAVGMHRHRRSAAPA